MAEVADNGDFQVIIGMDVIASGDFALTRSTEGTWVSFCLPALDEGIDYVAKVNRMIFAGVGRNDPCPCGSTDQSGGRLKFKKCCGRVS